jgi:hypothetical protein
MNMAIPQSVKACLWSYDINMIDFSLPSHRTRVIQNVLNRGTSEAVSWIRENFSENEIADVIKRSSISDWNKKSLSLWSLLFNVRPSKLGRFV